MQIGSSSTDAVFGLERKLDGCQAIADGNAAFLKKLEVRLFRFGGEAKASVENNEKRMRAQLYALKKEAEQGMQELSANVTQECC